MEPQEPNLPPDNEPRPMEPSAPPAPASGSCGLVGAGMTLGALLAAGGALFLLAAAGSTRTMGATRSVRLKWEQNQREAVAAVEADAQVGASTQPAGRWGGEVKND